MANQNERDPQITTTGYLKENRTGGEMITFNIHLALLTIKCIVNIPAEGETRSKVYLLFKVKNPLDQDRDEE